MLPRQLRRKDQNQTSEDSIFSDLEEYRTVTEQTDRELATMFAQKLAVVELVQACTTVAGTIKKRKAVKATPEAAREVKPKSKPKSATQKLTKRKAAKQKPRPQKKLGRKKRAGK